jgi:hypothetical protein
MRRFFRFTVRDLLWLTVAVAVGLGWFVRESGWTVRERQLLADAEQIEAKAAQTASLASQWETGARYLADILKEHGEYVSWHFEVACVFVDSRDKARSYPLNEGYPVKGRSIDD